MWRASGYGGSALVKDPISLSGVKNTRLVYSYSATWNLMRFEENMLVAVSDNGFKNCAYEEGAGCRIVEDYYNY